MTHYDYIVVGSGIAGLYSALLANKIGTVLILTKGSIDDCNTRHAQGGIAVAMGKDDSPELHFRDTIAAGAGLCNTEAVRILTDEAEESISDLIRNKVPFDTLNGEITFTKEAAHSVPRIIHAGGDATGEHVEVTFSRLVKNSSITVLEHCLASEIIIENNKLKGVKAIDCRTGFVDEYHASYLILATGGLGKLFKYTTNSEVVTGDGIALAYEAGAEICDMEFFQFHPTALRFAGIEPFLISEAVRGEGAILRNSDGHRFMYDYTPEAELAPRDVVSRSVIREMNKTNTDRVFLDATHLPKQRITTRFPNIYRFCLEHKLDMKKDMIPVSPVAHYLMGGVKVDSWSETSISGLFAIGEAACTGAHGANRLASNSLLEAVVFSRRAIERTKAYTNKPARTDNKRNSKEISSLEIDIERDISTVNLRNLQQTMWDNVGIIRSKESLEKTASILMKWQSLLPKAIDRPSCELKNLVLCARLMTHAALLRTESRGAHFRSDYPLSSKEWEGHIIFKQKKGEQKIEFEFCE